MNGPFAISVQADAPSNIPIRSLTILGGRDKSGAPENLALKVLPGDILCLVGRTGAGKSHLLADIECLAQGDTPSGRRILINDAPPPPTWRYATGRKMIAQISQTMSFVVDLSVAAFLFLHAECRRLPERENVVKEAIACANRLCGEPIGPDMALAQLSGGQSRALMIADTAVLSASPIVLIDEIENAGVDRKRALDLLVAKEKIVLISTHDPILALAGHKRLVIQNGAVSDVITTSAAELRNLAVLQRYDYALAALRHRLRAGDKIDGPLEWGF
jgi:ABC-type lipoprotein export system ATPase subunit